MTTLPRRLDARALLATVLWGVFGVALALAVVLGRGPDVLLLLIGIGIVVGASTTAWALVPTAALALLIPAPAMTLHFARLGPLEWVGFGTLASSVALLLLRRAPAHLGLAVLGPFCFFALCFAGGSRSQDAHTAAGLGCVWLAGGILGSYAAASREYLWRLTQALSPTAVFAVLECVGIPNYWNRVLGASKYAQWPTFGGLHRAMSTFGHPVVAGSVFAALALTAFSTRPHERRPWLAVLYVVACVATLSRSGVLSLAAGALVLAFLSGRATRRRLATVLTLVAITIASAVLGSGPTTTSTSSLGLSARLFAADSAGRSNALLILGHSIETNPSSVLFGGGANGAATYLQSIGGNTETGLLDDPDVFDDELVTAVYNFGALPLIGFALYLLAGIASASPEIRRTVLPPLTALLVASLFFDSLTWLSTSFLIFFFSGALTTFPLRTAVVTARSGPPAFRRWRSL